jgi:hypothetical protein
MIWTIVGVLLVLWLIGMVSGFLGGLIHILLVIAGAIFLVKLFTGRRTV